MGYTGNRMANWVTVTLSENVINLPGLVIIPFRDKFKI